MKQWGKVAAGEREVQEDKANSRKHISGLLKGVWLASQTEGNRHSFQRNDRDDFLSQELDCGGKG